MISLTFHTDIVQTVMITIIKKCLCITNFNYCGVVAGKTLGRQDEQMRHAAVVEGDSLNGRLP